MELLSFSYNPYESLAESQRYNLRNPFEFSDGLGWPEDNRDASALEELEQSMKSNSKEFCKSACNGSKHSYFLRRYFFTLNIFSKYLYILNIVNF